jgi:hypothetical protein
MSISRYTKIKRTIEQFQYCYPDQPICKDAITFSLNDDDFQARYVNY